MPLQPFMLQSTRIWDFLTLVHSPFSGLQILDLFLSARQSRVSAIFWGDYLAYYSVAPAVCRSCHCSGASEWLFSFVESGGSPFISRGKVCALGQKKFEHGQVTSGGSHHQGRAIQILLWPSPAAHISGVLARWSVLGFVPDCKSVWTVLRSLRKMALPRRAVLIESLDVGRETLRVEEDFCEAIGLEISVFGENWSGFVKKIKTLFTKRNTIWYIGLHKKGLIIQATL